MIPPEIKKSTGSTRYVFLLLSFWMAHLSMGATIAIVGPSLPYLGLNVGQPISVVSFVYTARSIGFVVTSVVTGLIFKRIIQGWQKLLWLGVSVFIMALGIIIVPFVNNIVFLLGALFLYGVGTGMLDTADNGLVIYLLGPKKSRSITQSLHFTLAIGAFILPFVIRPFLIQIGESNSTQSVCPTSDKNITSIDNFTIYNHSRTIDELVSSPLVWPYVIVAALCMIPCIMFLSLAAQRPNLVKHTNEITNIGDQQPVINLPRERRVKLDKSSKVLLVIVFMIFYFLHCGTENVFWSHLFAFGVCSDLKMSAGDATLLNMAFFGGFLAGRGSGVFIARCLRPIVIIILASTGCAVTTGLLSIFGQTYIIVTFISCIIYGYSIAMTFGAGISWLAQHIDVTGGISSTWFIGAYLGISAVPPIAGLLFDTSVGAIGAMYLTFGTSVSVIIAFVTMIMILRFARRSIIKSTYDMTAINLETS